MELWIVGTPLPPATVKLGSYLDSLKKDVRLQRPYYVKLTQNNLQCNVAQCKLKMIL